MFNRGLLNKSICPVVVDGKAMVCIMSYERTFLYPSCAPREDMVRMEQVSPRSLRRLGLAGVRQMTDRSTEIATTQGAKVRSIEDFRGVAEQAKIKRVALEQVLEAKRR